MLLYFIMKKEEIILAYKDVDILLDGIKLTEEKKDIFVRWKLIRNKITKHLLLNGHIFQAGIGFFRRFLKLKQSKKLNMLRRRSLEEIFKKNGIYFSTFKLLDKKRKIVLGISNKDGESCISALDIYEDSLLRSVIILLEMYEDTVLLNQYNVSPEKIKGKIVIDNGAHIGEFAIYCAKLGAKKVYAFEPVTETFKILEKQIELNNLKGKVIPLKMALGDKNEIGKIIFDGACDLGANVKDMAFETSSNSEQVRVIKLDDFIKKEKIGFIKMDVEGYEEKVLRGASRIIKRDKPILSFAAYHKPTDKQTLPKVVKEIRKDYKIKLLKRADEDFYCE